MSHPVQPLPGQQVIHVAQDLDTDLEALFNSVMNPRPSSWRKKLMPESFFKEPDSGSHSRQSSTDSGGHPGRPAAQHVRSHSSPASLQLGAAARPTSSTITHQRHQSYDVAEEMPLPLGWEMAFTPTGQKYFLNHMDKTTTWHDPRKAMTIAMNHLSLQNPAPVPHRSMAQSQPNLGILPEGWEQANTSQGETYYINHKTQSTTWLDPRLDACLMMSHQQPQQPAQPMGHGQQQSGQSALITMQNPPGPPQHQHSMLQRIQQERQRIRMRQQELRRQVADGAKQMEVALCRQMPMESESVNPGLVGTAPISQSVMPNSLPDPLSHYHSREQSTDSGLDLNSYSMTTTPEDFLSMDGMETGQSLTQGNMSVPQTNRFLDFLDSLPGTDVDLGTLEGADLIPILTEEEWC